MKKQKVCIIGGGLAGLITAATLSKLNLKIDLLTTTMKQNIKSNRTTAISQDNYDYLKRSNIIKFFEHDFWPSLKMKLYTESKSKKLISVMALLGFVSLWAAGTGQLTDFNKEPMWSNFFKQL